MSDYDNKFTNLVIANAMAVLFIGLIAGVVLVFSLMGAVALWPIPALEMDIPGSTRGWQASHVGGILNGVMIAVVALVMRHFELVGRKAFWVGWGMIITGWANTVFYWFGNFSSNRGLSVGETPFGAGDIAGAIAYLGGGVGMFFTFIAIGILTLHAFEQSRS